MVSLEGVRPRYRPQAQFTGHPQFLGVDRPDMPLQVSLSGILVIAYVALDRRSGKSRAGIDGSGADIDGMWAGIDGMWGGIDGKGAGIDGKGAGIDGRGAGIDGRGAGIDGM